MFCAAYDALAVVKDALILVFCAFPIPCNVIVLAEARLALAYAEYAYTLTVFAKLYDEYAYTLTLLANVNAAFALLKAKFAVFDALFAKEKLEVIYGCTFIPPRFSVFVIVSVVLTVTLLKYVTLPVTLILPFTVTLPLA